MEMQVQGLLRHSSVKQCDRQENATKHPLDMLPASVFLICVEGLKIREIPAIRRVCSSWHSRTTITELFKKSVLKQAICFLRNPFVDISARIGGDFESSIFANTSKYLICRNNGQLVVYNKESQTPFKVEKGFWYLERGVSLLLLKPAPLYRFFSLEGDQVFFLKEFCENQEDYQVQLMTCAVKDLEDPSRYRAFNSLPIVLKIDAYVLTWLKTDAGHLLITKQGGIYSIDSNGEVILSRVFPATATLTVRSAVLLGKDQLVLHHQSEDHSNDSLEVWNLNALDYRTSTGLLEKVPQCEIGVWEGQIYRIDATTVIRHDPQHLSSHEVVSEQFEESIRFFSQEIEGAQGRHCDLRSGYEHFILAIYPGLIHVTHKSYDSKNKTYFLRFDPFKYSQKRVAKRWQFIPRITYFYCFGTKLLRMASYSINCSDFTLKRNCMTSFIASYLSSEDEILIVTQAPWNSPTQPKHRLLSLSLSKDTTKDPYSVGNDIRDAIKYVAEQASP